MPSDFDSKLKRNILQALDECQGYLLPQSTLLSQVRLIGQPPSATEFNAALQWLESMGYVASVRPELGGDLKYRITERGKSILLNP